MTGHIGIGRDRAYTHAPTIRLFNEATGCYLHLSGAGETRHTQYAWCGYKRQARSLRAKASEWPYRARPIEDNGNQIQGGF